jgi:hypothetical protein
VSNGRELALAFTDIASVFDQTRISNRCFAEKHQLAISHVASSARGCRQFPAKTFR